MMKVSNMRLIVDPLETKKELPEVTQIAAQRWTSDPNPVSYIRSSTTFAFIFHREGQNTILRMQHSSDTSQDRIVSELAYLNHVAQSGVQVATPIESLAGELVESVEWGGHEFYATAFEYIPGKNSEIEDLTPKMIFSWGETSALIHEASRTFLVPERFTLPTWDTELEGLADFIPSSEIQIKQETKDIQRWLGRRTSTEATFGLIHRDLELDNMKWDGNQFVVYDFNDAMFHYFAADVASALEDPLESERAIECQERFLAGYGSVRDLSDIHIEEFPCFYRAARLRKYLRLSASYSDSDPDSDPEWLIVMRKYHEGVLARLRESIVAPFDWS